MDNRKFNKLKAIITGGLGILGVIGTIMIEQPYGTIFFLMCMVPLWYWILFSKPKRNE